MRTGGIEPPTSPWQGDILPLNYVRFILKSLLKKGLVQSIYFDRICIPNEIETISLGIQIKKHKNKTTLGTLVPKFINKYHD